MTMTEGVIVNAMKGEGNTKYMRGSILVMDAVAKQSEPNITVGLQSG